ncbi:MAG: ketosteroid isomerase-like protein [Planctomycetota bacterium]|jgi:ketosteroid isomerase-like protein
MWAARTQAGVAEWNASSRLCANSSRRRCVSLSSIGEGHTPASLSGKSIFNTLESIRVRAVLEDFHDAASKADGKRYFDHFAPGAIYMGTDATERWTLAEFRSYAEPYFSKGRGWTDVASERNAYVSKEGQTAWFDELLDNDSYGVTRGTGVMLRGKDRWRLSQYHLTIPVPNPLAKQLVEMIRKGDSPSGD